MRVVLVQPTPGERISGGYLYNERMATHGAWQLLNVSDGELAIHLAHLTADLVIADSIWLSEASIAPFLSLIERGVRVAAMVHSFPSMIAAAENGAELRAHPSDFELEVLDRMGWALFPGPHYPQMLRSRTLRTHILAPGLDDEWRRPPRPRKDPCALLSVGAVTPRKGFLDVAELLAARARHDDYHWTVIGDLSLDRDYANAVRARVQPLGSVTLEGRRSHSETRSMVQRADILVMPSYDENHPLILLEAMAAGVPCVAYAAGAAERMLGRGKAGLVSAIGDKRQLAAHIERLLGDECERQELARGCVELGRRIPSWAEAAAQAQELWQSMSTH